MKTSELFRQVKFKDVFNSLYKKHYKNQKLPQNKMIELSMYYQKLFSEQQNNHTLITNSGNKEDLAAFLLYTIHTQKQ